MNLTDINSPAELVLENEKSRDPVEAMAHYSSALNPLETLVVAQQLVKKLANWHQQVFDNNDEAHVQWAIDANTLRQIYSQLDDIAL